MKLKYLYLPYLTVNIISILMESFFNKIVITTDVINLTSGNKLKLTSNYNLFNTIYINAKKEIKSRVEKSKEKSNQNTKKQDKVEEQVKEEEYIHFAHSDDSEVSDIHNINDLTIRNNNEKLNKGTMLLACSMLGKFAQESKKTNKKLKLKIEEFSEEYSYDINQSYNIISLMLLRNCFKTIELELALRLISGHEKPVRAHLEYLNIIGVLSEFSKSNKEKLFDELDDLNNQLVNLSSKLDDLKKEKTILEQEERRRTENTKRREQEKAKEEELYEKGVSFPDSKDPTKTITIKPNRPNSNSNSNKDKDKDRSKSYDTNNDKKNYKQEENSFLDDISIKILGYLDLLYYYLAMTLNYLLLFVVNLSKNFPEIAIGILVVVIIAISNLFSGRKKKKEKNNKQQK